MTSTYGERLYASLYSQTFQNANPRGWSLSPAEVTEALDALAAKARDYATKPSRETMIEQFRLAFPGEQSNWLPGRGAEQEYATWLDDVAWDIATAPEPVDDEPADVQTSGQPYPDDSPHRNFHPDAMDALKEWAHDGVNDVADGVDAQATALLERTPRAWMSDSCATSGAAKDFLGAVMRWKVARNAEAVTPEVGMVFSVIGDRPLSTPYSHGDHVTVVGVTTNDIGPVYEVLREGDRISLFLYRRHLSARPVQTSGQTIGEVIDAQTQPLQDEVTSLKARLEQAEQNYVNAQTHHRNDLDIIARHFWENAHRRGWCSEAEDVIDEINEETHLKLETDRDVYRPKAAFYPDIDVRFTARDDHDLEWTLNVTLEVEVMGVDLDDARENITSAIIIAKAKSLWPNLPDDLRVDEWDYA